MLLLTVQSPCLTHKNEFLISFVVFFVCGVVGLDLDDISE